MGATFQQHICLWAAYATLNADPIPLVKILS